MKNKKTVVSLGGGAFLNNKIKREILDKHISFWLNWEPKTLIKRIKNSKKRPLALNASKNELHKLIKIVISFILMHSIKLNVKTYKKWNSRQNKENIWKLLNF